MTSNPAHGPRRSLRGDGGFILIEVLVSALILVTVSLAVFLTIDNSESAAGNQQRRSLAANFAQSEIERLRAMPVEDLAKARGTRTVVDQGGKSGDNDSIAMEYYEKIDAKWVTDGKDEPECSTRTGGLDYLRLTVEVSWKDMGAAKPVKTTSYYTPPAGAGGGDTGSMSIYITDRNGNGVAGIGVTADGTQDFSETTNANGCVVFGFVPAGDYAVKFQRSGFVDGDSNSSVNVSPVRVIGGETMKLQFDYDRGGTTRVQFRTKVPRRDLSDPIETYPRQVQFFNAAQPTPPKTFEMSGSTSLWDGTNSPLFPFTSAYAVYAGNCQKNFPGNPNGKYVNITPGAFQNTGVVELPALDVQVWNGSSALSTGVPVANALVRFYPGCGAAWTSRTDADGWVKDPGFPYTPVGGGGVLCAASPGTGPSSLRFAVARDNSSFAGAPFRLYLKAPGYRTGGYTNDDFDCTA